MKLATILFALSIVFTAGIAGCANAAEPSQSPREYLDGALNWMQTHAVSSNKVDWNAVRRDAAALVPNPKTTGDTYPAIRLALSRLTDGNAFFLLPEGSNYDPGINLSYPENVVMSVSAGGPAEKAGVRVGDTVQMINGAPPQPLDGNPASFFVDFGPGTELRLTLRREGQAGPVQVSYKQAPADMDMQGKPIVSRLRGDARGVGYIELSTDSGANPAAGHYTGQVQKFMREADQSQVCGWIIDLRRNTGGDLWTYLAAVGPLLGGENIGGFAYPDGKRDTWTYQDGKIKWNQEVRDESAVEGGVYKLKQPDAPVVLLVRHSTIAAGELVVVAFGGRPGVHIVGEATGGVATLTDHTPLSDGAHLFVSGAYGIDRTGQVYDKPIEPDETVRTDWTKFGTGDDAVIGAARVWLAAQPACSQ